MCTITTAYLVVAVTRIPRPMKQVKTQPWTQHWLVRGAAWEIGAHSDDVCPGCRTSRVVLKARVL